MGGILRAISFFCPLFFRPLFFRPFFFPQSANRPIFQFHFREITIPLTDISSADLAFARARWARKQSA